MILSLTRTSSEARRACNCSSRSMRDQLPRAPSISRPFLWPARLNLMGGRSGDHDVFLSDSYLLRRFPDAIRFTLVHTGALRFTNSDAGDGPDQGAPFALRTSLGLVPGPRGACDRASLYSITGSLYIITGSLYSITGSWYSIK